MLLYNQWDSDTGQPLLANEVARQIRYIIDTAIAQYYPNVENIVLVGGDNAIPFFRVPDETKISNEGDYYSQLTSAGALNTAAAARTKPTLAAARSTATSRPTTTTPTAGRRPGAGAGCTCPNRRSAAWLRRPTISGTTSWPMIRFSIAATHM